MDVFELAIRAIDDYSREFDRLERRQAQSMRKAQELDAAMRDQGGGGAGGLAGDVGELAGDAAGARNQIAGLADDALALAGGAGRAGGSLAGMAEGLVGMAGVAGIAAAGIGAVVVAAQKVYELALEGEGLKDQIAVLDGLSAAYGVMGRQAAVQLRDLSEDTLTWMEANRLATAAISADHGKLAASYAELYDIAQMVARAGGGQAEELLPKIVEAAASGDIGKLDQATGGFLRLTEAVQKWSLANDTAFASMTPLERQQVLLNIALDEGANFARQTGLDMATMAETTQGVGTAISDLGDSLKIFLAGQGWVRRLNEDLAGLAQSATGFLDVRNQAAATRQEIELLIAQIESQNQGTPVALEGTFAALEQLDYYASRMSDEGMLASLQIVKQQLLDLGLIKEPVEQGATALELFQTKVIELRDASLGQQPMIDQLAQIDAQVQILMADLPGLPPLTEEAFDASAIRSFLDRVLELNPNLADMVGQVWENVTAYQALRSAMGGIPGTIPGFDYTAGFLAERAGAGDAAAARRREREREAQQSARLAEQAARQAQAAWDRAYNEIQSRAERALMAGRNVTQLDWMETEAGTRQDAPLEAARRLDAIAQRGFDELKAHPDWAALLAIPESVLAGSEAGLKAWAMRTADQVSNLARPDLIDWDAFLANYNQMAQDEAGKEQSLKMAVDLVLAQGDERDPKKAQKLVEKMFGVGGMPLEIAPSLPPAAAEDFAGQMASSMEAAMSQFDMAGKVAASWSTSLDEHKTDYEDLGRTAGGWMGGVFVTAVKDSVGNVRAELASLLAPEVAAIIERNAAGKALK